MLMKKVKGEGWRADARPVAVAEERRLLAIEEVTTPNRPAGGPVVTMPGVGVRAGSDTGSGTGSGTGSTGR